MSEFSKPAEPGSDRDDTLKELAALRRPAPDGFSGRVMARLTETGRSEQGLWPAGYRWIAPALAGAAAALVLAALLPRAAPDRTAEPDRVLVQFVFHAPEAERVELVGDFTGWEPGRLHLEGPDRGGRWTARVELPVGRYEYMFLVDGRRWVTDPLAEAYRPDGFGNVNAVMNI